MKNSELLRLFEEEEYEKAIREVDSRFGVSSEELGRWEFTKDIAWWCIKQVFK